jgi:hypothetical protein
MFWDTTSPPISAFPPTSRLFDNLSEPSTSTRAPRKRLLLENRALFWQWLQPCQRKCRILFSCVPQTSGALSNFH